MAGVPQRLGDRKVHFEPGGGDARPPISDIGNVRASRAGSPLARYGIYTSPPQLRHSRAEVEPSGGDPLARSPGARKYPEDASMISGLANPQRFLSVTAPVARWLGPVVAVLFAAGIWLRLHRAPGLPAGRHGADHVRARAGRCAARRVRLRRRGLPRFLGAGPGATPGRRPPPRPPRRSAQGFAFLARPPAPASGPPMCPGGVWTRGDLDADHLPVLSRLHGAPGRDRRRAEGGARRRDPGPDRADQPADRPFLRELVEHPAPGRLGVPAGAARPSPSACWRPCWSWRWPTPCCSSCSCRSCASALNLRRRAAALAVKAAGVA